jgi:ribosomal protein L34
MNLKPRPAHKSRAGVEYSAKEGPTIQPLFETRPRVEGYPLRYKTADGTEYVQRNGVRYRLDKIVAA